MNLDSRTPSLFDQPRSAAKKFTEKQSRLIELLRTGKYSALDISSILHIGDARSEIRNIRKMGVNVRDVWAKSKDSRYKLYFIE